LPALYDPFDEQKLWVGKGVIDPMFLTPTNEFPRCHRPSFKRGLRVPVIKSLVDFTFKLFPLGE